MKIRITKKTRLFLVKFEADYFGGRKTMVTGKVTTYRYNEFGIPKIIDVHEETLMDIERTIKRLDSKG